MLVDAKADAEVLHFEQVLCCVVACHVFISATSLPDVFGMETKTLASFTSAWDPAHHATRR
jgi:uncharacterized membrane protein